MKKFFQYFEDMWVAVTFAEAGEYDMVPEQKHVPECEEEAAYAHVS